MDQTGQTITERVVGAVAAKRGTDPLELPPLYETIDPDTLGTFVDALTDATATFRYAGTRVVVAADGGVDVTAAAEAEPPRARTDK